jgi:hypothetical protein
VLLKYDLVSHSMPYSIDYSYGPHYIHTNCMKSCIDMGFYPCFALQSYPTRPSFLQPLAFAELLKLLLIVWAFLFGTGLNCNTQLSASNKGCRLVLQQITSPLFTTDNFPFITAGVFKPLLEVPQSFHVFDLFHS